MGLDMFLSKKIGIYEEYDHNEIKTSVKITIEKKTITLKEKISSIDIAVGYWCKANQIHNWFVKNIQNGVDDCGDYHVSEVKLTDLLTICKKVQYDNSLAPELLPTQGGFFFGGIAYDEYYDDDIIHTIKIIETVLKGLKKDKKNDLYPQLYYHSSW